MIRIILVSALFFQTLLSALSYAQAPDYTGYSQLLSNCVDKQGQVDYAGIVGDKAILDRFVSYIAGFDSTKYAALTTDDQLAFWINVYNSLTLKLISDNYPIRPVWYKMPFLPRNSVLMLPGKARQGYFTVMGRSVKLGTIRNTILRERFGEARVNLALVDGYKGGPPLRAEPYTGEKLAGQLDDQSYRFLNRPENLVVDQLKKKIYLSKLFKKCGGDFVKHYLKSGPVKNFEPEQNAALNFISQYVEHRAGLFIHSGDYEIKYLPFDRSLNGQ